jgi:hypothetical protein
VLIDHGAGVLSVIAIFQPLSGFERVDKLLELASFWVGNLNGDDHPCALEAPILETMSLHNSLVCDAHGTVSERVY